MRGSVLPLIGYPTPHSASNSPASTKLSTRTPHDELISALRDENAAPRNILRAKNEVITVQVNELRALEDELAENNGLIVGLEGKLQAHISEPSQQNIYNFYGVMKMTTPQNVDIPLPPRP
ncbi:hypothetical protein HBH86_052340 [Parastagonospora nodorum]|nr:hypothetical protein HBH93_042560 [Parastagonospora nodorum]KAH4463662.1 hypothetical protein HBH91_042630 [Parastagonospora nodorum]KAH4551430.1 hypothetical protein HBH85_037510 [Parastagonospora nodorum]KAH4564741.1 hypothetical protein HBH86_052340 [Parastagonospora nodorum]KAH4883958.1 hypothetical protein HBH58_051660 [Parastagonospora nodorum]